MKKNGTLRIMGVYLRHVTGEKLCCTVQKEILTEYHRILRRSGEIGPGNPLASAYALGAWFIAMVRKSGCSPEESYQIMETGLRSSRLFRLAMGNAEQYLAPKRVRKQMAWAKTTHQRRYGNDWVVDCLPGNGAYDLGYDYLECGICKLCTAEGCPELACYLCRLDFLFAEVMGLQLERTMTLAEGGAKCDFRFSRK